MKRRMTTTVLTAVLALSMSIPAFAGQWQQEAAGWRYQNDDGISYNNGWSWIDGKCYYFDTNGYMLADTATPDGCMVDGTGAWIVDGVVQTQKAEADGQAQNTEDVAGYYWPSSLRVNTTGETEQFEYSGYMVGNFNLEPQADGNMKATYPNNEVDGMPSYIFTKTGDNTYQRTDSIGRPVILTIVDSQTVTVTESDGLFTYIYKKR